jgi:ATP-binding cassette subfamily B protein
LISPADKPPTIAPSEATRRLVSRFRARPWATAGVLALQVVRTALEIASPLLVGRAVGSLEGSEGRGPPLPAAFVTAFWAFVAAIALRSVFQYASAFAAAKLGQDLENSLRADLFAHVMRLRFRWHDENRSGKTIARSLRDMERAKAFFREVAFGYVEVGLVVTGALVLTFATHWTYGVAVGGVIVLVVVAIARAGHRIAAMDRGVSDLYDGVTTALQENVAGARVVRAFGQEPAEVGRFGGRLGSFTDAWTGLGRYWTTAMPLISHFSSLVVPVALTVAAFRVVEAGGGAAAFGEAISVLLYVRTVRDRLRPMTRVVLLGQEAAASAARVFEVLDRGDVLGVPAAPKALPAGPLDLELRDVELAYPGGKPVLRGVSLRVPAGTTLGILGPTGAGKTTLLHLVPRFYDPDVGSVRLGGVDVRDLDPRELVRTVGLAFQESFLFSATVAENVAYGREGLPRERVQACARLAAASEFVEKLPGGYDTRVGERGVSLSGGQRQRLAIARALAADPRVLLFDDATASVDAVTERELFRGIRDASRGRTTLVVSQRVTAVRWCDRIAVLEGGRVTAFGTPAEVERSSALWREVLVHQTLEGALP